MVGSLPSTIGSLTELHGLYVSDSQQLSGNLPPSIGALSSLKQLVIFSTAISGSIPEEIGSLTVMEVLVLFANQMSGSIPSVIGSLSNLTSLLLGYNAFNSTIPSSIGSLTSLTSLYLEGNQLSGSIPYSLGLLTNLLTLRLTNNMLTGALPSIGNLTQLEDLTILGGGNVFGLLQRPFVCGSGDDPSVCEALSDLFNSTGGAQWSSSVLLSDPYTQWSGNVSGSFNDYRTSFWLRAALGFNATFCSPMQCESQQWVYNSSAQNFF